MKLKCIGGPNDGDFVNVSDDLRRNDICQVRGRVESSYHFGAAAEYLQDTITVNINLYRLRELRFKREYVDKTFKYLTPEGEDEFDCIIRKLES